MSDTDPDEQITDAYFEAQARESMDAQYGVTLSFEGLTGDNRVIFGIDSEDIDAEAFAVSLKRTMKLAAMDDASWPSSFVGALTVGTDVQFSGPISPAYGQNKLSLTTPDLPKRVKAWTLARTPRVDEDTSKDVDKHVSLASEYGCVDTPYITAKIDSAVSFNEDTNTARYDVRTAHHDESLSFTFTVPDPQSDTDADAFTQLVEAAGGSPEYLPGTRVGVRPSWASPSTAHLADSDGRGFWAVGIQDAIERSRMTVFGRVLNALR